MARFIVEASILGLKIAHQRHFVHWNCIQRIANARKPMLLFA
jgi:hypothetical protein